MFFQERRRKEGDFEVMKDISPIQKKGNGNIQRVGQFMVIEVSVLIYMVKLSKVVWRSLVPSVAS